MGLSLPGRGIPSNPPRHNQNKEAIMRIIKTYTNGRFYDTLNKTYISKEQLAALFNKKEEIAITMHKTGSDVTKSVMKQLGPLLDTKKHPKLNIDNIKNWVSDQVDRRIAKAIALINLPSRDQINRLTADIETLAKQIDGLQNSLVKKKATVQQQKKVPAKTVSEQVE
jgi:polyhydroxyalkanoate synthesis regulator protein